MLRAKMQFSAILGHFLPQAPGCATLRCTFLSQIFYNLCFSVFPQILDPLDQDRLDLCFMQVCSSMLLYSQCSPTSQFQLSRLFLFLHGCATALGSYGYSDYEVQPYGLLSSCSSSLATLLVHFLVAMRTLQLHPCADFLASASLQPLVCCPPFLLFI